MAMPARKLRSAQKPDSPLRVVGTKRRKGKESGPPLHYMECRALGHAWQHQPKPASDQELGFRRPAAADAGSYAFVSTCANCGTVRTKWISRSGMILPPNYRYPDGYEHRGEMERMSHLDWRKAYVVRAIA